MTTERNIIIHAGQAFTLSLDYAGTVGRGQRMHIRASDAAADVIAILTHNGDANARVIYDGTDSLDIAIGASVNGGWLVGANRVEWVYDIEDYDLSDTDDVVIAYRGKVIVYGNRTRPEDVTPSAALPSGDGRYVRFDTDAQGLTDAQKLAARTNIGAGTGGGGGSGDVVGPASATDDRIAAFDGSTGKLIKQGTVTATAVASHLSNTSNPHSVTAAQVGADPAGTASSAVSTHNSVTTGAHGMTAFGASLVDDADASAARTTLGLGTAATAATGDFAAASHTHAASDVTSGTFEAARLPAASETAQGAVELATTAEALTGTDTTRAVTAAGVKAVADTKAASSHAHAASDITSGTLDAARLPAATTSASGTVELATVAECQAGTDTTRATTPEGVAAAIAALGLAQPLTTVRATRQSSALSAASAGETKFQFRDIVRAGLLACKTDIGDELILFPPLTHPFLTGAWFSSGTSAPPSKGVGSNLFGGAFTASTVLNSIGAVNIPSSATAGQEGIWYANSFTTRDGSAVGDGYLMFGLVGFPDASYGSGATGAVCRMGLYASGSLPTSGARASAASCVLEYNTTTSDTNWLLAVHNGTDVATSSTGLAFSAQKDYFYMIHSPRGGSSTYAYIANLTDGTSGSTSLARNTGSTALSRYSGVLTRTTTARNTRFACQFVLHGGQI